MKKLRFYDHDAWLTWNRLAIAGIVFVFGGIAWAFTPRTAQLVAQVAESAVDKTIVIHGDMKELQKVAFAIFNVAHNTPGLKVNDVDQQPAEGTRQASIRFSLSGRGWGPVIDELHEGYEHYKLESVMSSPARHSEPYKTLILRAAYDKVEKIMQARQAADDLVAEQITAGVMGDLAKHIRRQ